VIRASAVGRVRMGSRFSTDSTVSTGRRVSRVSMVRR
jgi:hypothetical protein